MRRGAPECPRSRADSSARPARPGASTRAASGPPSSPPWSPRPSRPTASRTRAGPRPPSSRPSPRAWPTSPRPQLDAFPGNLFWDLDLIAADVLRQGLESAGGPDGAAALALVEDRFARMVRLQALYGRGTAINFTYVHDFVYGFDWAKWVRREPSVQRDVPGPFSAEFLGYMERRGHELLELIAADDGKYPTLAAGVPRNPFPFSREPAAEVELHAELARRDLIPVPTWDAGAIAIDWDQRWREPFQDRRVEVAGELGLLS
ncbi:hypothetical protein [Plesiocystis pacifica]|nr:hypothetical protein [Plesiocystis pacifica]